MFVLEVAELRILIKNKYRYIEEQCSEYITDRTAEFEISVTEREISEEDENGYPRGYLESLAIYRKIAERIINYNGFLLHGVVAEVEGTGVAFLALSGVGKTTHAALWEKMLSDNFVIINGDKPLIRFINNSFYAYGTPWQGKEGFGINSKTELKKLCFIERAEKNECVKLQKKEVLKRLLPQLYRPADVAGYLKMIDHLDDFIDKLEFYLVKCNMDISAAKTAYEVIMK